MMRIVVSPRGDAYEVYRGDCHLGSVHRLARYRDEPIWRWRARSNHNHVGREQSLGEALYAIEQVCGRQLHYQGSARTSLTR